MFTSIVVTVSWALHSISVFFWFFLGRLKGVFRKPAKMNMVKRIMGRPRQEECSPQDNALGLMHLRRLFTELCHPPRHMTQKEQEEKLYMMLPVFNRVSPALLLLLGLLLLWWCLLFRVQWSQWGRWEGTAFKNFYLGRQIQNLSQV